MPVGLVQECWTDNFFNFLLSTWAMFLQVTFQQIWSKAQLATGKVQNTVYKKSIQLQSEEEKKCIVTCAQSVRPRSLTPAWASLKTCPRPVSPAQEKHFFHSQLCKSGRTLSLFFLFLVQPSFQGVFSPLSLSLSLSLTLSLPPSSSQSWFKLLFFCVAAPLGWAEWLDRELGRAPGLQREGKAGEGTGAREWFSAAVGPPTASHRGLQWCETGEPTPASEN